MTETGSNIDLTARIAEHAQVLANAETGAPGWLSGVVQEISAHAAAFPEILEDEQPPEFIYPH